MLEPPKELTPTRPNWVEWRKSLPQKMGHAGLSSLESFSVSLVNFHIVFDECHLA
jgi:hypothetical protein